MVSLKKTFRADLEHKGRRLNLWAERRDRRLAREAIAAGKWSRDRRTLAGFLAAEKPIRINARKSR